VLDWCTVTGAIMPGCWTTIPIGGVVPHAANSQSNFLFPWFDGVRAIPSIPMLPEEVTSVIQAWKQRVGLGHLRGAPRLLRRTLANSVAGSAFARGSALADAALSASVLGGWSTRDQGAVVMQTYISQNTQLLGSQIASVAAGRTMHERQEAIRTAAFVVANGDEEAHEQKGMNMRECSGSEEFEHRTWECVSAMMGQGVGTSKRGACVL